MEWLASNESSLSAIAAIIAIIAGSAVMFRLVWVRVVAKKRPAFLSDWRNIALIVLGVVALLSVLLLATSDSDVRISDGPVFDDSVSSNTSSEIETIPDDISAQTEISGKPSVAVLPLNNISGDPEQTYLADGIAEDVITLLSRNPRFFVIARNSSFTYKGQSVDIRQVGKELGVRYVVEGSLRKLGERLRVTVQLINTTNGQHIWAEQYDRPFAKIFELQDEITNGIAIALGDKIFSAEVSRASSTPTNNLDAWGLVMRANQALISWNRESTLQAVTLLRAALDLDPNYALAKAELARIICWRGINQWDDPVEASARAYELGDQALRAAPNDPLVLFAVGGCYGPTGRREEGIRLLKKAVAKQPSFAMGQSSLGMAYAFNGNPEKGLPYLEAGLELAPLSPYTWLYESWRSMTLNKMGRYEEAKRASENALESYDGWWISWVNLAVARAGQRDVKGAISALYKAKETETRLSLAYFEDSIAIMYENKGKKMLALLLPIWPDDLLTADE